MKKQIIALLLLSMLGVSVSFADSMRCGNKLVRTGDAKPYVLEVCGQPISDELVAWEDDQAIHHVAYKQNSNIKVLRFKGGILTTITDAKL